MVQNQFQTIIQNLEMTMVENTDFVLDNYLAIHGIIHLSSCPNTSQQNEAS